jgi:hypothetical protein
MYTKFGGQIYFYFEAVQHNLYVCVAQTKMNRLLPEQFILYQTIMTYNIKSIRIYKL